jgi:hypothetical protein
VLYDPTGALDLGANGLEGTLPTEMGGLTKLSQYCRDWCNDVHITVLIIIFDCLLSCSKYWSQQAQWHNPDNAGNLDQVDLSESWYE